MTAANKNPLMIHPLKFERKFPEAQTGSKQMDWKGSRLGSGSEELSCTTEDRIIRLAIWGRYYHRRKFKSINNYDRIYLMPTHRLKPVPPCAAGGTDSSL